MNSAWHRFVAPLTPGVRLLLFVLAAAYGAAITGLLLHSYNLYLWLGLFGPGFWHGRVWSIVTHPLLPATWVDFLFNWVVILSVGVYLEKIWSRWQLWTLCLISTVGAGLAKVLLDPVSPQLMVGTAPICFGLLAAWGTLFANEKVSLWFIWDMTVRQAAIILSIVSALIMVPCAGLKAVGFMLCGGLAALVSLWVQTRIARARSSRPYVSERIGRLEL